MQWSVVSGLSLFLVYVGFFVTHFNLDFLWYWAYLEHMTFAETNDDDDISSARAMWTTSVRRISLIARIDWGWQS